ncbi:hypothetical protein [Dactylosporangium sp. CA-092794]|uniref:hypothetical protein n=1 Tax=Dactylosporangium sp. CA-092794 TaxID=3239929 RepID=UPI003D90C5B2
MYRSVGVATAVALVIVTTPAPAFAEPGTVGFAESGLLRLQPGGHERIVLVNDGGNSVEVEASIVVTDGVAAAAAVSPADLHLDPGSIAAVEVAAPAAAGAKGFVVVLARSSSASPSVSRRPFRVASSSAAWTPLVAEWRITSTRGPAQHGMRNTRLPLARGASCGTRDATAPVGGLVLPGSGVATVTAVCQAGRPWVELSVDGIATAGDYKGTIDLAPDDDATGTLTLTVRQTDDVVFPMLLLLAGIAVALLAAWQSGRLSAVSQAREETWLLHVEADAAQQRFGAAAGGAAWQRYSLLPAVTTRLDEIRARLGRLRWGYTELTIDKGPYKEHVDALAEVRNLVDAWEGFAERLAALAAARNSVTESSAIAEHGTVLLSGDQPVSIAGFAPLVADVEATSTALSAWLSDREAMAKLAALAERLRPATQRSDTDARSLSEALAEVEAVREASSTASDGAAYLDLDVAARLQEQARVLNALRDRYLRLVSAGVDEANTGPVAAPQPVLPAPPVGRGDGAFTMARRMTQTRRLRNSLVFAAIAGVTVWTGLSTLYFDRAFGTWRDYVAIGVWGFGAQAGLNVLASALDRIVAGRMLRP